MVIRKVNVLSLGKILAVVQGALGLIAGIMLGLASIFGAGVVFPDMGSASGLFNLLFGAGAIVFLPLFYAATGFVTGVLTAAIYNLVARTIGGLELEVE